jgi:hypothetical protein
MGLCGWCGYFGFFDETEIIIPNLMLSFFAIAWSDSVPILTEM